jgi:hypothetical protein
MNAMTLFDYPKANAFARLSIIFFLSILPLSISAQEHTPDANTLLLLHCNGDLTGTQGETPAQATGVTFESGVFGNGAHFDAGNQVYFSSEGNISSLQGTLEFWIKPRWNGNDGLGYVVLRYGVEGGMLFFKDGGNFWRLILNRYGFGGKPELGAGINLSAEWRANEWHHCAFTWSSDSLNLYVDGIHRSGRQVASPLNVVNETTFQLGADFNDFYLDAVIDELRISDIARSAAEIRASFLAGISVSALAVQPDSIVLLETWRKTPTLVASTNFGPISFPPSAAQWSSSNPAIASVDQTGRLTGVSAGEASITASFRGAQATAAVIVKAPVLPPLVETIDPFLSTPASNHLFEIPVVILRYFPTQDGVNVDPVVSDWNSTLASLRAKIDRDAIHTKFMLEEGSRFRGYKDPAAPPSLGYRVIHIVTVFEEMPPGFPASGNPEIFFPDYDQIITRFGAENFVNNLGVKEFWLWGYHHGNIVPAESNMSSPTTGDISNSFRFEDDLPVFNHTYTLYNYNFTRGPNENVHNHGHQLEAILSYANSRQDGNTDLFWKKFVGQDVNGNFITGRCGWTHMPPNTTQHYDYYNTTLVASDIEDWRPDGAGATKLVNAQIWGNIAYAWPNNDPAPGQTEAQWYIYWMQNMPGQGNKIPHGQNDMTNWWEFTADWDRSINAGLGLYQSTLTTVKENEPALPAFFVLQQNYPNPFRSEATFPAQSGGNPETTIRFHLAKANHVVVKIFNTLGEKIRILVDKQYEAGDHRISWDGKDENGRAVASGVYLYQLQVADAANGGADNFSVVKKMSLLR